VQNRTLTVPKAIGVLANDTDPDGDALTAVQELVAPPAHGTLTLAADGSFTYAPDTDYIGADAFTYQVRDRLNATSQATVTLDVREQINLVYYQAALKATIYGGGASEKLKRTLTIVFLQEGDALVAQWAIEYWKDATGSYCRELPETAEALSLLDLGSGLAGMHWYLPAVGLGDAWLATGKRAPLHVGNGLLLALSKTLKGSFMTYTADGLAAGSGTISLKFDSKATLASNEVARSPVEAKSRRLLELDRLGFELIE